MEFKIKDCLTKFEYLISGLHPEMRADQLDLKKSVRLQILFRVTRYLTPDDPSLNMFLMELHRTVDNPPYKRWLDKDVTSATKNPYQQ